MPSKRNKGMKPSNASIYDMLDIDDSSVIETFSNLSDGAESVASSTCSRATNGEKVENSGGSTVADVQKALQDCLERLSTKAAKSATQSRINSLSRLVSVLRRCIPLRDYLMFDWREDLNSLLFYLLRLVQSSSYSESEKLSALICVSLLAVHLGEASTVSQWLDAEDGGLSGSQSEYEASNLGWQAALLALLSNRRGLLTLRKAALECLGVLCLVAGEDMSVGDLCLVLANHCNECKSGEQAALLPASVQVWSLLFSRLGTDRQVQQGLRFTADCLLPLLLVSECVSAALLVSQAAAGECLALVAESLLGAGAVGELSRLLRVQERQVTRAVRRLACCNPKGVSKHLSRDLRTRGRLVRDSLIAMLGSWLAGQSAPRKRLATLTNQNLSLVDNLPDLDHSENELVQFEEEEEEEEVDKELEDEAFLELSVLPGSSEVRFPHVKLPRTRETLQLTSWREKRIFDCLNSCLSGGLLFHLQCSVWMRTLFSLGAQQSGTANRQARGGGDLLTDSLDEQSDSLEMLDPRQAKQLRKLSFEISKKSGKQARNRLRRQRCNKLDVHCLEDE